MRVAIYYSNNDIRIQEMPVPQIKDGEILMKVIASGICGSDVMEWYRRDKVPLVLGHETAGEIVECKNTPGFKTGDRIAVTHHVPCNTCHYCLNDHHTACATLQKGTHFDPGGFAEYIRIPAINVDRGTFHIPDEVSFEQASFMEPLACVVRGQRAARVKPGHTILVIGCGIAGLLHIATAKALGAELIIGADTIDFRLNMAKNMGADYAVDISSGNLNKLIKDINSGLLADVVVICHGEFIEQGLRSVEKGGTVLMFASAPEAATIPVPVNDIFWRTEATLTSSYAGSPSDCTLAMKLLRKNIPVEKLITHKLKLEEAQKGFGFVASPVKNNSIKVIIEPHKK